MNSNNQMHGNNSFNVNGFDNSGQMRVQQVANGPAVTNVSNDEQTLQNLPESITRNPQFSRMFKRKPGLDFGTFLWPILMIIVFFAVSIIVQIVAYMLKISSDPSFLEGIGTDADKAFKAIIEFTFQSFIPMALAYSIIQILILVPFLMSRNKKENNYILTKVNSKFAWIGTPIIALGTLGITTLWMVLVQFLGQSSKFWADQAGTYADTSSIFMQGNPFLMVLVVCVLVPIAEELLFRGVVLNELRRVMPGWLAAVIAATIFGIVHGNLIQSTYATVAGIVLGLVYLWSNSIYCSILMHIIFNFFGSGFQLLLLRYLGEEQAEIIIGTVNIVFIALGLVAIPFLVKMWKINNKEEHKAKPIVRPEFREFLLNVLHGKTGMKVPGAMPANVGMYAPVNTPANYAVNAPNNPNNPYMASNMDANRAFNRGVSMNSQMNPKMNSQMNANLNQNVQSSAAVMNGRNVSPYLTYQNNSSAVQNQNVAPVSHNINSEQTNNWHNPYVGDINKQADEARIENHDKVESGSKVVLEKSDNVGNEASLDNESSGDNLEKQE